MNSVPPRPSLDDVLSAFAVEPDPGRDTLENYLRRFPEYAPDLVDLSVELSRPGTSFDESLSDSEKMLIDSSWEKYGLAVAAATADPFTSLSLDRLRHVAKSLSVPRQILSAFRDRIVVVSSVPRPFLQHLAASLERSLDEIVAYLEQPPSSAVALSHKADEKPGIREPVEFEQLLIEAGVSDDHRVQLLTEEE